jgi:ATP-dependent DNA helicase RecG
MGEAWGSGGDRFSGGIEIQRIRSACLAMGLVEPLIREKGDFVDVEFYRLEITSAGYRRIPPDILTPQESDILSHIDQYGSITASVVEKILGVKERRSREVLKEMTEMTEKGWLVKRGSARSTSYVRGPV